MKVAAKEIMTKWPHKTKGKQSPKNSINVPKSVQLSPAQKSAFLRKKKLRKQNSR